MFVKKDDLAFIPTLDADFTASTNIKEFKYNFKKLIYFVCREGEVIGM